MGVRRLVISDLHFGSGDDLLRSPEVLERIAPELDWCDELVINGDLFEFVFAPMADAVQAARPFLKLVSERVESVIYVPGNHDHHLVEVAGEERRLAEIYGVPDPQPFRVGAAERLLSFLCPGVQVLSAYPLLELSGMRIIHGHYIAAHVQSFGWRLLDRLSWELTGDQRPERLQVAEYEALLTPLYSMLYEMVNLPQGRAAQASIERRFAVIGAVLGAPSKVSHQAVALARNLLRRGAQSELDVDSQMPNAQAVDAISAVCENLQIPAGKVLFAHTHTPLCGERSPDGSWELYNSGSWCFDRRLRSHPRYRETSWPGTVLRCDADRVELVGLLEDLDETALAAMLGWEETSRRRRMAFQRRGAITIQPAA